jgi:hypothetical protein
MIGTVRAAGIHPVTHGVYANAQGPRFETKAEIRALAVVGDVVGMTAAHEASACIELGLPYAMLTVVDNYANGVGPNFTVDEFHSQQAANLGIVKTAVAALLTAVCNAGGVTSAAMTAAAVADSSEGQVSAPVLGAGANEAQEALAKLLAPRPVAEKTSAAPASSAAGAAAPSASGVPMSPCGPTEVELIVNAR